jgi:hypothetical protein
MTKPKLEKCEFLGSFQTLPGKEGEVIYTVTSSTKNHRTRCWGWYPKKEDAFAAVKMNAGDMHECEYTHIVIEEVPAGVPPYSEAIQWFRYIKNKKYTSGHWVKCKKPEWAGGVINYSLG